MTTRLNLECTICGKFFHRRDVYRCHIRIHNNEKPYACSVCGKRFAHSGNRNQHQSTHQSTCSYKCQLCNKTCLSKIYLQRHMKNVHPAHYIPSKIGQVNPKRRGTKGLCKVEKTVKGNDQICYKTEKDKFAHKLLNSHSIQIGSIHNDEVPESKELLSRNSFRSSSQQNLLSTSPLQVKCSNEPSGCETSYKAALEDKVYLPQSLTPSSESCSNNQEARNPQLMDNFKCELCFMVFEQRHKYQLHIMIHELEEASSDVSAAQSGSLSRSTLLLPSGEEVDEVPDKNVHAILPNLKGFSAEDLQTVQMIYSRTSAART